MVNMRCKLLSQKAHKQWLWRASPLTISSGKH
jgi:hypothetical protein